MNALKINYEWNMLITSNVHGEIISDITTRLEKEWNESIPLNYEWIQKYKVNYQTTFKENNSTIVSETPMIKNTPYITPNKMQKIALKNLSALRKEGKIKGLLISATGTGKTFLAAFDVAQFKPKHMLFIVHREQILNKAKESFKKIIGGPESDYGILSGSKKNLSAKYLFATIQTISRDNYLKQFSPETFDYILIDEVHKAGADSYTKVIDYFNPEFLLGMTATPERTDNFNIYELFDYNIAYEIRLQEAIEEDLLCPFHYFGVTDYEKDGNIISETSNLAYLTNSERVKFILEKIDYYGCSYNDPKALVFCSKKEEAKKLCKLFNKAGRKSAFLTGEHSIIEREKVISQLEFGEINYIFTVDIFNEGIDIPKLNQVIMLRNTQSSIIFIQQLGRGLRKDPSKEFVTVIDFIGNYQNNYMIPMALSGDISRNKNNLRKDTFDTTYISGLSSVNFEAVAKEKIYQAIDSAKLDDMKALRDIFKNLKNRINRVPYLHDFATNGVLDPLIIANKGKSYYDFLLKVKENEETIPEDSNMMLSFASRELLSGMRQHELILLEQLLTHPSLPISNFIELLIKHHLDTNTETIHSVLRTLSLDFYTGSFESTYQGKEFIHYDEHSIFRSRLFTESLKNSYFHFLLKDLIDTGLLKSKTYLPSEPLTLYKKYRRRDVIRLLNWKEQMIDQNIGGYTYKNGKFVIFMKIEKGEDFKGAQMAYEDAILDSERILYYTRSPRNMNSPETKILLEPLDWEFYIFVQKSDDEGIDYYYLGKVFPIHDTIHELMKPIKGGAKRSVVECEFLLKNPLNHKFYQYLISED